VVERMKYECRKCGLHLNLDQTQHGSHMLLGDQGFYECGPIDEVEERLETAEVRLELEICKCSSCQGPWSEPTGHCHTILVRLCGPCARDWVRWLKQREGSMRARLRNKRSGERQEESFSDCAARSIIGD